MQLGRRKNDKKVKIKGGLGWIRRLRGQEQDMSSSPCNGNHFCSIEFIDVSLQFFYYIKTNIFYKPICLHAGLYYEYNPIKVFDEYKKNFLI